MTDTLLQDHHLKSFGSQEEAAEYAQTLYPATITANWHLLAAALETQGVTMTRFTIAKDEGEHSAPYLAGIAHIGKGGQEVGLQDEGLDFLIPARAGTDSCVEVGVMEMGWPLEARLAIQANAYLDLVKPGWNTPGAPSAWLDIEARGTPRLSTF